MFCPLACTLSNVEYVLFLALLVASLVACTEDATSTPNVNQKGSSELVVSLRRRLMENNYDYITSESEDFPAKHEREHRRAVSYTPSSPHSHNDDTPGLLSYVNDIYISSTKNVPPVDDDKVKEHGVDDVHNLQYGTGSEGETAKPQKNDLLYYLDDGHMSRRAGDVHPVLTDEADSDTTTTFKYKVFKLKDAVGVKSRRSGGSPRDGYRRFVQVEGEDGVAILSLDDQPFPEFRLPRANRLYMPDEEPPPENDLEIALPSDLEDPVMRPA